MVKDETAAAGISPIRCAVRTLYYGVQTTHAETNNPLAHFVGEEEAPHHVCFVNGRLHLVQAGWSKAETETILKGEVEEIVTAPQEVHTPAFASSEVDEIRRAFNYVERNGLTLADVLPRLAPSLVREIRRIAGNRVWRDWAHDSIQTDLRLALEASVAAVGPDTPYPDALESTQAMETARSIRLNF